MLNLLTLTMTSHTTRLTFLYTSIGLLIILTGSIFSSTISTPTLAQQDKVVLTAMVAEPNKRWDRLFQDALVKLRERHMHIHNIHQNSILHHINNLRPYAFSNFS